MGSARVRKAVVSESELSEGLSIPSLRRRLSDTTTHLLTIVGESLSGYCVVATASLVLDWPGLIENGSSADRRDAWCMEWSGSSSGWPNRARVWLLHWKVAIASAMTCGSESRVLIVFLSPWTARRMIEEPWIREMSVCADQKRNGVTRWEKKAPFISKHRQDLSRKVFALDARFFYFFILSLHLLSLEAKPYVRHYIRYTKYSGPQSLFAFSSPSRPQHPYRAHPRWSLPTETQHENAVFGHARPKTTWWVHVCYISLMACCWIK